MTKSEFYNKLNRDETLKSYLMEYYQANLSKIIELIISRDIMKNPMVDLSENVVDVDVLNVPILAALFDAHYHGMYTQFKKEKNDEK